MDHFDGRVDRLRPLGEFAFNLLRRSIECEFEIIISPLVLKELIYNSCEQSLRDLLPSFDAKGKIIRAEINDDDMQKTRVLCQERKTHFNDTLHAVIANKMNATFLVTRNIKDFYELQELVQVRLPEQL